MRIIPNLYLQKGKAVSLYKGHENEQKKVYSKSPLNLARDFMRQGATQIQLIDLDGQNQKLIQQIIEGVKIPVQVAGGIRDLETIDQLFKQGVASVVLGVSARHILAEAIQKYGPNRVYFGIKARRDYVDSDSLPPESDEVIEIAEQAVEAGATYIIYQDLERQGMLFHPNYDDVDRLILLLGEEIKIISAGGISHMNDLEILNSINCHSVLISRAFIEHEITFSEIKSAGFEV